MCKSTKGIHRFLCILLVICLFSSFFSFSAMGVQSTTRSPIDPDEYWGKQQLATLNNGNALVYAYEQLAKGVENSTSEISLSAPFRNYYITWDEFQTVLYTYIRDYPQHFWLGNSYSYRQNSSGKITAFIPSYVLSGAALTTARQQFDTAVKEVLDHITNDMTESQIEKYIHDYLAEKISYTGGRTHSHNAYGALVEGKSVCEGYAESFQYLLYQAGILCVTVTGDAYSTGSTTPEAHAWSLVNIDDEFYYVDLTWNDQDLAVPFYAYYNVTTADMERDHILDERPYDFPLCTATKHNYFTSYGAALDSWNINEVANAFRKVGNYSQFRITDETFDFWSAFSQKRSLITNRVNVIGTANYTAYIMQDVYLVIINGQLRGDVNADKFFNDCDLTALLDHCTGTRLITDNTLLKAADVNQDNQVDIRDHQRLYEHIKQTRLINTVGEGIPTASNQKVQLELQPECCELSAEEGSKEVIYTITLTPPAGEQVHALTATIEIPTNTTWNGATLADELSSHFEIAMVNGEEILLSGCHTPITQKTVIAYLSIIINDCSVPQTYALSISDAICSSNTENHSLIDHCDALTILSSSDTNDKHAAQAVDNMISILNVQTLDDENAVLAARKAYNDLTDTQKQLVTNLALLQAAEERIEQLKAEAERLAADKAAAEVVQTQISTLNVQTMDDEDDVLAARNAYNDLTDTQKQLVTNLTKLQAAEETIEQLKAEAEKFAADKAAAKTVIDLIAKLSNNITLEEEENVVEARKAFDNLTASQKNHVTNLERLTQAEYTIANIKATEADKLAAQAVIDAIAALDASDQEAIVAARAAYTNLTEAQKALVTNINKLEELEQPNTPIIPKYGDVDGDGNISASDALVVLKSVVGKVILTNEQTTVSDLDGNGKADAADALLILKKVVGKIDHFPVEK